MANENKGKVITTVSLDHAHHDWLTKNSISLSRYVAKKIEEDMK